MKFLFLLLTLCGLAYANDTAMHDGGSGPEPVGWPEGKESIIRMEREEVMVEMGPFDSTPTCRLWCGATVARIANVLPLIDADISGANPLLRLVDQKLIIRHCKCHCLHRRSICIFDLV